MPTINIDDLPGNSRDKPDKPLFQGTVSMKAEAPKRRHGFAEDLHNIGDSLFSTVIMPALKAAVNDFVTRGVEMLLFGGDRQGSSRQALGGVPKRDYSRISTIRRPGVEPARRVQTLQRAPNTDDVIFTNRRDAEAVLGNMYETLATYGWVTVGDFYSMVGMSNEQINERYGWYSLEGSNIRWKSDGYSVVLPTPSFAN